MGIEITLGAFLLPYGREWKGWGEGSNKKSERSLCQ